VRVFMMGLFQVKGGWGTPRQADKTNRVPHRTLARVGLFRRACPGQTLA